MTNWNEAEHPRDDEGKFTYKNGGGSNSTLYGRIEYNDKKDNREDILYKNTSLKKNLSNYRNKLVNFLNNNLDRAEILFSNVSELENKILDDTMSTIKISREKLYNSINGLSKNDFKSNTDFQNLVKKAQNTYKALNDFEAETSNMFKINTKKEENGLGENVISNVLKYKSAIEKDCNEIIITAQKIKKPNGLINQDKIKKEEIPVNNSTKSKPQRENANMPSQIKTNSKINIENNAKEPSSDQTANWIMPCEGRISSYYGKRKAPVDGASTFHSGIDIAVPVGTPVKAITDGKIRIASGGITGYGNAIYINHGKINDKIIESEYGHLSKIYVIKGQNVKRGQVIGLSGGAKGAPGSGYSSGPHLHLTIREYDLDMKNKKHEDPNKYLKYN